MSIDISSETVQSFADATKTIPGRPNLSTLHRWRLRGVRGVKLESCLIGGRRFTSLEAIKRFAAATTAAASTQASPHQSPSRRQLAIDRAERELADDGI